MNEAQKDTQRARAACISIRDGRPIEDGPAIAVTLDHTVSVLLLALMGNNPEAARHLLHNGLVPGVEARLRNFETARAARGHQY